MRGTRSDRMRREDENEGKKSGWERGKAERSVERKDGQKQSMHTGCQERRAGLVPYLQAHS